MKKMINFIKNNIFGFILGILLFSGVGVVYAAIASNTITYSNATSGSSATTVQGALDDLYSKASQIKRIKIGDYISLTPAKASYSIAASETGYSAAQTIKPNELKLWRVIKIEGNGIDVVSEYVSSTNVTFGVSKGTSSTISATDTNVVGYRKYIKTLNTIAAQYTDNNLVISTRHMGYDSSKSTAEITNTSKLISTTAPWACSTDISCGTDEIYGGGDLGCLTDVDLVVSALGTAVANKVSAISTGTDYWLASRYYTRDSSTRWAYRLRRYKASNYVGGTAIFYNGDNGDSLFHFNAYSYAIRPILTLKPTVKIVSGEGKVNSPYVLG